MLCLSRIFQSSSRENVQEKYDLTTIRAPNTAPTFIHKTRSFFFVSGRFAKQCSFYCVLWRHAGDKSGDSPSHPSVRPPVRRHRHMSSDGLQLAAPSDDRVSLGAYLEEPSRFGREDANTHGAEKRKRDCESESLWE